MKMRTLFALLASALVLVACGGGGGGSDSCEAGDEKSWLRCHMAEWYFWYALAPQPDPAAYADLDSFFDASLFQGDTVFPADRWSYYESTESFNRFFGDGKNPGYGMSVAGLEVEGRPDLPLRVRYIEPLSDAATQGLRRGEQIVSINGVPASTYIANDDFSVLVPANPGDTLNLVVRNGAGDRSVSLVAGIHSLTPVNGVAVVQSPGGRRTGYIQIKDMINQVLPPLDSAFASFRSQGVSEVVLDLRYNGGGLVSVGRSVASYVGGNRTSGRDFVRLLYNDKRAPINNQTFAFENPSAATGLARVYVLTGPRTCSASEQVINGLAPFVDVVRIGDTTCGKPVGFLPQSNAGNTFSVVAFESVNQANQGRYWDGLVATCDVADDLDHPLGSTAEGLLAAARTHADTGACPVLARRAQPLAARGEGRATKRLAEPGERQGMYAR
jgi:carboxyl-terminal processing protease